MSANKLFPVTCCCIRAFCVPLCVLGNPSNSVLTLSEYHEIYPLTCILLQFLPYEDSCGVDALIMGLVFWMRNTKLRGGYVIWLHHFIADAAIKS